MTFFSGKEFSHRQAAAAALFVTILWSTSWVLIKFGLGSLPALTFAGLRYTMAWLCLLPFCLRTGGLQVLANSSRRDWMLLVALGLVYYAGAQGAQYVSLAYLPAVTVNLLISFTVLVVALLSKALLGEAPTAWQWGGIILALAGGIVFFHPVQVPGSQAAGWAAAGVCLACNAVGVILGREINRRQNMPALHVTGASMGVGALALLGAGLAFQGLPPVGWKEIGIILWLAVVNTALTFTIWNHAQRILTATEISVINNAMMVEIPILAVFVLGERLTLQNLAGMGIVIAGILCVQLAGNQKSPDNLQGAARQADIS